jgi:phage-related protein
LPACGDSPQCLREFAEDARRDAGHQLDNVQRGERPDDFRPMPSIGKGVEEIHVAGRYLLVPCELLRKTR